jgi:1,4-dihydroxy-2-naphthoate octaprenyltransferase
MGVSVNTRAAPLSDARAMPLRRVLKIVILVRYRFFLYAGLMPYLLGTVWGYATARAFDASIFWSALAGVVLAVVGVEAFNEYFDSRLGSDRVFNPEDLPPMSVVVFRIGVAAFAGALAIGGYLTWRCGWPILGFAVLGGLAAIFYAAPPIRWAYRGLGELVIGLSYGPWLVLGSVYLQTQHITGGAFLASLVPGLLVMALAVVNAIPDFQQDRLVGKRNLVVRLGRRRAVGLYVGLAGTGLGVACVGAIVGEFPHACLAVLLAVPLLVTSARRARLTYEHPRRFAPAIRSILLCYMLAVALFALGIASPVWR